MTLKLDATSHIHLRLAPSGSEAGLQHIHSRISNFYDGQRTQHYWFRIERSKIWYGECDNASSSVLSVCLLAMYSITHWIPITRKSISLGLCCLDGRHSAMHNPDALRTTVWALLIKVKVHAHCTVEKSAGGKWLSLTLDHVKRKIKPFLAAEAALTTAKIFAHSAKRVLYQRYCLQTDSSPNHTYTVHVPKKEAMTLDNHPIYSNMARQSWAVRLLMTPAVHFVKYMLRINSPPLPS